MIEKIQTLLDRRSIRNYQVNQITEEELKVVLEAGKYAPSGMGEFKWKFAVVQKNGAMEKVLKGLDMEFGMKGSPFYNAPTLIIVFVDKDAHTPVQDGSLAIGNMLNAAHMLGLGSCWINCIPGFFGTKSGKALQQEFNIPSEYICVGSCAIGYINGEIPQAKVRNDSIVVRTK